jgi:Domain of unknown function (DUF6431)
LDFLQEAEPRFLPSILADRSGKRDPCEVTILFVPVSVPLERLAACWAEDSDEIILRRCPVCEQDSIVGHGRRRKQAHDEHNDWIGIRRGRCVRCGKTFTFLPVFSLPYTHYSLLTRCQALLRRFVEHCSWEKAAPKFKDADRVPDCSTVRRWSQGVDESEPALSFLRKTAARATQWLESTHSLQDESAFLSWLTPVLEVLCPMRR